LLDGFKNDYLPQYVDFFLKEYTYEKLNYTSTVKLRTRTSRGSNTSLLKGLSLHFLYYLICNANAHLALKERRKTERKKLLKLSQQNF